MSSKLGAIQPLPVFQLLRSGQKVLRQTWRGTFNIEVPDQTTVGELLNRYQRQILPSHKGQQVEAYRLKTIKKHFGDLRLIHLTPKEVASYRNLRLKEVSSASLKRELTILSRILTVASRDWGISIPQNPVKMISLPKADRARTRRIEAGEKERLLQGANPELNRIIALALETGMRRGEILSIKKSHINFPKSVLFIPSTKTDTPRTIPLFKSGYNCSQRASPATSPCRSARQPRKPSSQ